MTTSPPGGVGEADPDELVAELVALAVVCLLARRLAALRLLLVMRVRAVLAEVRAWVWRRRPRQLAVSRMWAAGQGHRREVSAAARQARDRHVRVIRRPRRGPCGTGRPPAPPRPSMPSTRA